MCESHESPRIKKSIPYKSTATVKCDELQLYCVIKPECIRMAEMK